MLTRLAIGHSGGDQIGFWDRIVGYCLCAVDFYTTNRCTEVSPSTIVERSVVVGVKSLRRIVGRIQHKRNARSTAYVNRLVVDHLH